MKNNLKANFQLLTQRISQAAQQHNRALDSIKLLAVSKKHNSAAIRGAHELGITCFAENYLQEALAKQQELKDINIEWHFIGHIQSNKTRQLSAHFTWIHTIDKPKIATRLSQQRPVELGVLNVCIQYNISLEPSKAGISQDAELLELAKLIIALPNLRLRGLMAIPAIEHAQTGHAFSALASKLDWLKSELTMSESAHLDTLSMGMSNDLELAIAHGSTMLRVGTALFGSRN